MSKKVAVYIPEGLYEKIQEEIKGTEFLSVEDYIVFVLEELLKEEDEPDSVLTEEEEELIKKRLKGLGYL